MATSLKSARKTAGGSPSINLPIPFEPGPVRPATPPYMASTLST